MEPLLRDPLTAHIPPITEVAGGFPEDLQGVAKRQPVAALAWLASADRFPLPPAQDLDGVLALAPGRQTKAVEDLSPFRASGGGIPIPEFSSQLVPVLDSQSLASLLGVIPS